MTTKAPAFDNTLGAAFIGGILASILYGVTCVQTFIFFNSGRNQRLYLKGVVLTLWSLDTIHLICVCHALYWYLITNFLNAFVLEKLAWYRGWCPSHAHERYNCPEVVFTYRVWILSGKSRLLTYPLILMIFLVQLDGLASGIKALMSPTFVVLAEFTWVLYVGFILSVVADWAIAMVLCYYLYRSRSGIKSTDSLISVLMAYTINIGLLTSVCFLACFITYAVMKNYVFLALYFPISKLYVNSLLATLNARESLQARDLAYSTGFPMTQQTQIEFRPGRSTTQEGVRIRFSHVTSKY
ncbi:hypothetical protein C8J56DRAFT_30161 [Mycena floridula]|nr:hypothetical protein C8J56DRAFT_30161 [Mycena floridula]